MNTLHTDAGTEDLRQLDLASQRAEADIQFILESLAVNARAHAEFVAEMKKLRAAMDG